ncbi:MAG: PBP1A family penicillin-binding protein [Alphaproteobacteria bacterium]|nr:PBP1A family penicillin-binding protein [Alphaproteobacteria bacterium]
MAAAKKKKNTSTKKKTPVKVIKRKSLLRRLTNLLATLFVTLGVVWAALFLTLAPEMPDTSSLWRVKKSPGVTVLAADGSVLAQRGAFNSTMVPIAAMPAYLPRAIIATEDRRFYQHFGMDIIGLFRAVLANLRAGGVVQGGSTITQQLAKNLFLTPERTLVRKIRELMLALWLEARLSKDEILTLYMNRVYLGAGSYGVEAASQRYFGKSARRVSLQEAALLAGLLKAPSRYAPTNNIKRSRDRAAQVLQNMVAAGYLMEGQAAAARRAPARLAHRTRAKSSQYFSDWVQERVPGLVGNRDDDLIILTTLEPELQRAAEAALTRTLSRHGKSRKVAQGALVAVGSDGAVRAMVGGRSYAKSQFNRAVQAHRQPGSAFKPFVYLAALEAGFDPSDVIKDSPVTINGWKPRNFANKHRGNVTLSGALVQSINTVAVKVSERVGREKVIATARRMGITSPLKAHPALALGASEVTLLELTSAYAPFANGGFAVVSHGILEVRTRAGRTLYRRGGSSLGRVVNAHDLTRMNAMLTEVLRSGTGRGARLDDRVSAGKTGTSQKYRDGWFIGYTADLITGVWLGNDNDAPTRKMTGGQLPASLWKGFMRQASVGQPARTLPSGRAVAVLSPDTGQASTEGGSIDFKRFINGLAGMLSEISRQPARTPSSRDHDLDRENSD